MIQSTEAERDEALQKLHTSAATISTQYRPSGPDPWAGSPYRWIHDLANVPMNCAMGDVLVDVVQRTLCIEAKVLTHQRASYLLMGWKQQQMVLKTSALWKGKRYLFQQIRKGAAGSHVLCFGISPQTAHLWVVPTAEPMLYSAPQHKGPAGHAANYKLSVNPERPHTWLAPYGGTLADGLLTLFEATQ